MRDLTVGRIAPIAGAFVMVWGMTRSAAAQVPAAAPAPAPIAAVIPDDRFCRSVAAQDATNNALDAATQQRIAQQSLAQCQALFGHATSH